MRLNKNKAIPTNQTAPNKSHALKHPLNSDPLKRDGIVQEIGAI